MWALVTPSWWWCMAAWLQSKADFCGHVAVSIQEAQDPKESSRYFTSHEPKGVISLPGKPADEAELDNAINTAVERAGPGEEGYVPRGLATAEELDARYKLTEKGWQEGAHCEREHYMTHGVIRTPSDDGLTVKVTGWCTGCTPDNCVGCWHIESVDE